VRKRSATVIVLVISILVYTLLFPRPVKRQLLVTPRWSLSLRTAPVEPEEGTVLGFRLGDLLGYVTPAGRLVHLEPVLYNAAITDTDYVNYSSVSQNIVFQDFRGHFLRAVKATGYPLLTAGRTFVFGPDGATLSEWDQSGAQLWQNRFTSILTSVDANDSQLIAGFVDGTVRILDRNGEDVYSVHPEGSRLSVIAGAAISADGSYAAVISGLDPQRLLLYARDDTGYVPYVNQELGSDFRRPVIVTFVDDDRYVVYENKAGVGATNVVSGHTGGVSLEGSLREIVVQDGITGTISSIGNGTLAFNALLLPGIPLFSIRFPGSNTFLRSNADRFLLGVDDTVLSFSLEEG